jgi:hypothetical protein
MMRRFTISTCAVLTTVALLGGRASLCRADDWDLNQTVLQFAIDHLGQQVGDGQCWTLADQALRNAGAQPPGTGGLGIYEYGRQLDPDENIWPGDVIQFEGALFISDDGSWWDMPHHTAIVYAVDGRELTLINQNAPLPIVTSEDINQDDLQQGTMTTYRPQYP